MVAKGCLKAVPNAGYFVRGSSGGAALPEEPSLDFDFDSQLLLHKVFEPLGMEERPGVGLLPDQWLDVDGSSEAFAVCRG